MARFQFAHEDPSLATLLARYGWIYKDDRTSDIIKNDGSRVGITGPHGRWFAEFQGALLHGKNKGVRYFNSPSTAILAVEECYL